MVMLPPTGRPVKEVNAKVTAEVVAFIMNRSLTFIAIPAFETCPNTSARTCTAFDAITSLLVDTVALPPGTTLAPMLRPVKVMITFEFAPTTNPEVVTII
jgi:hypothetical protein